MSAIVVPSASLPPSAGLDEARLAEFDRLSGGLTGWMAASEGIFLEAGERLRAAHGRIAQVRDGISRATEIFTRPLMTDVRDRLGAAAECAQTAERLTGERGECLVALHAAIDHAAADSEAVKAVFKTLDYVVLIARTQVESTHSSQDELVSFARAVDDLVTSGAGIANAISEHMRVVLSSLRESRAIDGRARSLSDGAGWVRSFADLIDLIETHERSASARRDEAQAAFTAVWQAVAGAVMGLQSHDMARQRLEHTVRNLAAMATLGADGTFEANEEPIPAAFRSAAMRRVARLEIAQLSDLSATYGALMTKLGEDLAEIAEKLEACGLVLDRLRPAAEPNDSGLAALDAQAALLRGEIRKGDDLRGQLTESMRHNVKETGLLIEMTDQMGELEFQLNLAGLNAAIQAAHVEGGDATVGYIASVIRDQASQARLGADKVRRGIELAATSTETLAGQLLPRIAEAEQGIDENLSCASERLTEAEAESGAALDRSVRAAQGLGQEIRSVLDLMGAHGEGRQMMLALTAAIEAALAGLPEEELPQPHAGRLDGFLCAAYTMREERDVFARTLGSDLASMSDAPETAADASAPPPAEADDFDDILF